MSCNEFAPIVLRATRLCLFRMPQGNEITTFLATSTTPSTTPKINFKKNPNFCFEQVCIREMLSASKH